jgi:hypothetical protein
LLFVGAHPDEDDVKSNLPDTLDSTALSTSREFSRVCDKDIASPIECRRRTWVNLPTLTDDKNVGILPKEPRESFAEETILDHQKYADRGSRDCALRRRHFFGTT